MRSPPVADPAASRPAVHRPDADGPGGPARRDRRDLQAFVALAYLTSWSWLVPLALAGAVVTAGSGSPTHVPALLGPMLAALLVTARRDGVRGLRELTGRMTRWRAPLRWWLFAVSPLVLLLVVLGVQAVLGLSRPSAGDFAAFTGLPSGWGALAVAATIFLVNGFGEETGWRGFALVRLQRRHSPLVATLVLAAVWAGWHLPMFFVVDTFRTFTAPILVGWLIGLACGAVVLTWLYNRSGGSILLVALWHATYNVISGTRAGTGLLAATSTTLVMLLAVTLVGLEVRTSRRGLPSVLGPA